MIAQVRPSKFKDWLQTHSSAEQPPLVLDVREAWELRTACVRPDGFELMTIPMNAIPARMFELDKDRPIACLCHHGGRSMRVAMFLAQQGFTQVANIEGGINAWAQECDSTVPCY